MSYWVNEHGEAEGDEVERFIQVILGFMQYRGPMPEEGMLRAAIVTFEEEVRR